MRGRFKSWAKPLLEAHPEYVIFNEQDSFLKEAKECEIGAGKGDFAIGMAKKGHCLVALERDISCAGLFLKKLLQEEEQLALKILPLDFDKCVSYFHEGQFQIVYLNFSDPWPKKKHEKRRLLYPPRLKEIGKFLAPDGEIRFKTDNDSLFEYGLKAIPLAGFSFLKVEEDYSLEESDVMSEYERNFRAEGKKIHRIVFQKEGQ